MRALRQRTSADGKSGSGSGFSSVLPEVGAPREISPEGQPLDLILDLILGLEVGS
jgi:hypothetical protein